MKCLHAFPRTIVKGGLFLASDLNHGHHSENQTTDNLPTIESVSVVR